MTVSVTPGQENECTHAVRVLDGIRVRRLRGRPRQRPCCVAGDKGYSSRAIRTWLRCKKVRAVIPERKDQIRHRRSRPLAFDAERYKRRNVVERAVGWIKERRRIATRFEKLATHFVAMLQLAMIQQHLNRYLSDAAYGGVVVEADLLGRAVTRRAWSPRRGRLAGVACEHSGQEPRTEYRTRVRGRRLLARAKSF